MALWGEPNEPSGVSTPGPTRAHPWINRTIKGLSSRKQCYFKRARQTNSPEHWLEYHKIKVECRRECQNIYNKYITNLVQWRIYTRAQALVNLACALVNL